MQQPSLSEAIANGKTGALNAALHADSNEAEWSIKASILFIDYARDVMKGKPFLTESAREWAEDQGLSTPPDNRAWGHVTRAMREAGHIVFDGYAPAKTSNGSPKCLWRFA
jgi:hypothetical protein